MTKINTNWDFNLYKMYFLKITVPSLQPPFPVLKLCTKLSLRRNVWNPSFRRDIGYNANTSQQQIILNKKLHLVINDQLNLPEKCKSQMLSIWLRIATSSWATSFLPSWSHDNNWEDGFQWEKIHSYILIKHLLWARQGTSIEEITENDHVLALIGAYIWLRRYG